MTATDVNALPTQRQVTYPALKPSEPLMVREERDNSYQHNARLAKWLREIPVEFPKHIGMSEGMPALFNQMIGPEYKDTCQNVSHVLEMLRNLVVPSNAEKSGFSLTEEGTRGFVCILDCMTSALRFERNYRNNNYGSSSD